MKLVPKPKSKYTSAMLTQFAREYITLREQEKTITNRKKELAELLKENVAAYGNKDSNGSVYYDTGDLIFGKANKIAVTLNPDKVLAFFAEHDLSEHIVTKKVRYVPETTIEELFESGEISADDLELMVDKKQSFSVVVSRKEEMPEVQQTVAADSKKRTLAEMLRGG